ncbi:MAG: hypothetical protein IT363_09170 [Methanoregulaceae archaeon]|nr:hypothetical protein [Methanoregulaceae archaeon]
MLGLFFYIAGCVIASIILTFIYSMFRSVQSRDEYKSWRVMAIFFVLVLSAPYGYNEYLTRSAGPDLKEAVLEGLSDAGVNGTLAYYRVVKRTADSCRIVAVMTEKQDWGGTERPVVAITAKKDAKGWHSDSYIVVNSISRNADSYTFPPYY